MKLIKKNNKKGFTLIELVIVIAILAILALILVPTIGNYTKKANVATAESSVRSLFTEAVLLHSENNDITDIETKIAPDGKEDDVTVVISTDKTKVESVQYTYKGIVAKFDGKDLETTGK